MEEGPAGLGLPVSRLAGRQKVGPANLKSTPEPPTRAQPDPSLSLPKDVIRVSKKFLPGMAVGYSSSKLTLHVGDGFEFMKQNQDAFDVIITDSSDPMGRPEAGLGEGSFPHPTREWGQNLEAPESGMIGSLGLSLSATDPGSRFNSAPTLLTVLSLEGVEGTQPGLSSHCSGLPVQGLPRVSSRSPTTSS